jgi:hypothetical protein
MRHLSGTIILLAGAVLLGAGSITEGLLAVGHGWTPAGKFALLRGILFGVFGLVLVMAATLGHNRREPHPPGHARPQ